MGETSLNIIEVESNNAVRQLQAWEKIKDNCSLREAR
jgi:hypothetical protein